MGRGGQRHEFPVLLQSIPGATGTIATSTSALTARKGVTDQHQ